MIICSCNGLSDNDVRRCAADRDRRINVGEVYTALGCRPNCGICARTIRSILAEVSGADCAGCPVRAQIEAARARNAAPSPQSADFAPSGDILVAAE